MRGEIVAQEKSLIGRQNDGELRVETIVTMAGFRALENEWLALEARLPSLPFQTFDWFALWWEHMAERRLLMKDNLRVLAFRDAQGRLVGVAPLMLTQYPGFDFISTRQLQFFGADPNLTEIRSLVAPVADQARVYAAFMRHLRSHSGEWDWLLLTGVPESQELNQIVETPFARVEWLRTIPDYTLELPATFEEFKSSRSRNIKESLRKCYNSLKRDGLSFEFRVLSEAADVEPALTHFFRLHRARAELSDTIAHNDAFEAESSRNFLRAFCRRAAMRGRLRLFQLVIDERVVATRIGFVCDRSLYLYYSGYDPAFRQYSVMTTVLAEAVRYAIESELSSVNLSTGRDTAKTRWSPDETNYRDALVVSPSLRGGLAHAACSLAKGTLQAARERSPLFDVLGRRAKSERRPDAPPTPELELCGSGAE